MNPRLSHRITAATVADVPDIVGLVESAYRGDSSRAGWTTEASLLEGQRTDSTEVCDAIEAPDSIVLTARDDNGILGCCHLKRVDEQDAYFGMFAVNPTLQGGGVGRSLLAHAENLAATEWQSRRMTMSVITQRAELIAWYERMGYKATGQRKPFPYGDERFGVPLRDDLDFSVLAKEIDLESD